MKGLRKYFSLILRFQALDITTPVDESMCAYVCKLYMALKFLIEKLCLYLVLFSRCS